VRSGSGAAHAWDASDCVALLAKRHRRRAFALCKSLPICTPPTPFMLHEWAGVLHTKGAWKGIEPSSPRGGCRDLDDYA